MRLEKCYLPVLAWDNIWLLTSVSHCSKSIIGEETDVEVIFHGNIVNKELRCKYSCRICFTMPAVLWRFHYIIGITDLIQIPAPLHYPEVCGTINSNPLIRWDYKFQPSLILAASHHPEVLSKSHLININPAVVERACYTSK